MIYVFILIFFGDDADHGYCYYDYIDEYNKDLPNSLIHNMNISVNKSTIFDKSWDNIKSILDRYIICEKICNQCHNH